MRRLVAVCTCLLFFVSAEAQKPGKSTVRPAAASANWDQLVDDFLANAYFKFNPTQGTAAGFHQYDTQLEDYSQANIDRQIAALQKYDKLFGDAKVSGEQAADRELLLSQINGALLELQEVRGWQKKPDLYSGGLSNSIFTIMSRNFAPPEARVRSVIAREKQVPKLF